MNKDYPVSFHNVAELETAEAGLNGVTLRRFPRSVRNDPTLSRIGRQFTSHSSNGCEIRFVSSDSLVRLHLASSWDQARVFILRGDYVYHSGFFPIRAGQVTTLTLEAPNFSERKDEVFVADRFPNTLWRVYCLDTSITFCGIDSSTISCRPPSLGEQPKRRWLAYGSSITQSGEEYYGYVNVAAQTLGVDAYNLGMGGSCFMEPSVAEFIAGRQDWDFATLELGINVLGQLSVEEFATRARRMVRTIHEAQPQKPVFVVTTFRNGLDFATKTDPVWVEPNRKHREILAGIVREISSARVQLLDGMEVFRDFTGFQADLLHPSPLACVRAGERLAAMLSDRLRF